MSVVTLADVKAYLNITVATYDVELQTFIDGAESAIAKKVGPLAPTSTTRQVDGYGCELVLPVVPAISLTSVTPNTGGALVVGDLNLTPAGVVTYTTSQGTFPAAWYTVAYSAGRASLPSDLSLAVKEFVRHMWSTQRGPTARPGQGAANGGAQFAAQVGALPQRILELIGPHLQPGFA